MIDWYFVFSNSLWILGLSIVLAAFSYHHWLAGERGRRLREQFREPGWILPFAGGMFLTCLGLGILESTRWWERVIWLALAASFAWQGWRDGYRPLSARPRHLSAARPSTKLGTNGVDGLGTNDSRTAQAQGSRSERSLERQPKP